MLTTILFDLDGTLLPMDQEHFVKTYLGLLAQKMAPKGYDLNPEPGPLGGPEAGGLPSHYHLRQFLPL